MIKIKILQQTIEAIWAIKAMEHAEVYFNVSFFNAGIVSILYFYL